MRTVLVVDDSLTVRMDLAEALEGAGFRVVLCPDLASARRALEGRTFALVVLDVLLPDGDGLELLAELKGSPRHGRTPVLLLSTEAEVQHRVRGLHTGADEYVGKPYDPAHVVLRARQLVRPAELLASAAGPRGPVLLVDDSATAREELREAVEAAGLEVLTATSAEEGLRLAAERRPAAVVVDGVLPGMDGASFVRQLRGDAVLRPTPCVLLTASDALGEVSALEAGADAYLRKEEGTAVVVARLLALLRTAAPSPAPAPAAGAPAPHRVLALAGGEARARDVVEALRQDGHDVVLATSAPEAAALLAVDGVDCVLVDARSLPRALDACAMLRAEPARRDVPLVLLGDDDPAGALRALDAGADDHVSAASGLEVLRARVRAQVRRKGFADEQRARAAYERNAAILETIADAFFAVDARWRFVYVNAPMERLLGASREAVAGARMDAHAAALAGGRVEAELRRAAADGAPATFEVEVGDGRWLEVRAFPHAEGLSVHLRDVTERRRTQEVQAHLLGIVGHDLRTPLTALSASAAMVLRDPALPEKHRRALERVSSSAARMSRLIRDLLDYSKARLGQGIPVHPRPCDLDAICREALDDVRGAHAGRAIEYRGEGEGAGEWDPDRLRQVVTNLLTNAVRYGAESAPVTLSWIAAPGAAVRLAVHNEGEPIEARLLDHMFEPFKRGDAQGTAWGGVGLGLYIVRQIVLAHGGAISVASTAGAGTTFEVRLPVRPPERGA